VSGGWLEELLGQFGKPIPCACCGRPAPSGELREVAVPGMRIAEWDVVVDQVVWVCDRCPAGPVAIPPVGAGPPVRPADGHSAG